MTDLHTGVPIDIGIVEADRLEIADGLSRLLADTYTLYLKTHHYHWNVTGPMFQTLHLMFETEYTELAMAVDLIAERIRALGVRAPGSYHEFAALSSVPDDEDVPDATEMMGEAVLFGVGDVPLGELVTEAAAWLGLTPSGVRTAS